MSLELRHHALTDRCRGASESDALTQLSSAGWGDVKSRACHYSRDPCAEWAPRVRRRPFCGRSTETMNISTTTVPLLLTSKLQSSASTQGAVQWGGLGKPCHMNHIPSFALLPVMVSAALGTGGSLTRRASSSSQQDRYIPM